ncbi:T-cell receptor gamma chain V region V108A [Fukomys damarensis]|nr:T-cell receptor gamma chain V region V108A [Fukomys damarensis]
MLWTVVLLLVFLPAVNRAWSGQIKQCGQGHLGHTSEREAFRTSFPRTLFLTGGERLRKKTNQALEHLIQVNSLTTPAGAKNNKVSAKKDPTTLSSTLTIHLAEKEDMAIYYCAGWDAQCLDCGEDPHKIPSLGLC